MGIWFAAIAVHAAAEGLRLSQKLDMKLQPDHRLVLGKSSGDRTVVVDISTTILAIDRVVISCGYLHLPSGRNLPGRDSLPEGRLIRAMILPFVREVLADLENCVPFERVRRHLSAGSGRRSVSGLTFTARALYFPLFVRAANTPCLALVADNKAAEELHATILATCELTGALAPDSVLRFPAHDVLPFENLSPHPEILETRAATLWKIATGAARLVIAPVEAACMRLFPRDHYAALALHLKCGDEVLPDMLVEHLLSVGYTRVDVVDMPGQVTLRGGILDAYSPEMDRPARIEFFDDQIESIRRFDPETQRSASTLDEALLLPLTETPVTNKILAAINARLTRSGTADGANLEGGEEPVELLSHAANRTEEATIFPGWEFFAPIARTAVHANLTLLDMFGPDVRAFVEEPVMVKNQGERWWNKVEQRHERSGIGSLVRPEDIYISPWELNHRLRKFSGCDLDQLGSVDVLDADRSDLSEIGFSTRPTQRFHGNIPALIEAINTLTHQEARVLIAAPNQGEVERLAGLLQEYHLPYRLGSRTQTSGNSMALQRIEHTRRRPAHTGHCSHRHFQRCACPRPARCGWPRHGSSDCSVWRKRSRR